MIWLFSTYPRSSHISLRKMGKSYMAYHQNQLQLVSNLGSNFLMLNIFQPSNRILESSSLFTRLYTVLRLCFLLMLFNWLRTSLAFLNIEHISIIAHFWFEISFSKKKVFLLNNRRTCLVLLYCKYPQWWHFLYFLLHFFRKKKLVSASSWHQ